MTWEQALAEAKRVGLARCSDAAAMASFCQNTIQILVGAVSGRLVWEGAMRRQMTLKQLAALCHESPLSVGELMWS